MRARVFLLSLATLVAGSVVQAQSFLGTIRGILQPFSVVASLVGPLFAAYVYDTVGSYNMAFLVIIVCLLLSVVLLWIALLWLPAQPNATTPESPHPA